MSGAKTDASVDSTVDAVNADGYAVVHDLLSPDDGAVARTELHEILATTPSGRDDFEDRKTRTDRSRLGVVLHYGVAWLRPVENHGLAVPPAVVAGLTPRMQELLGYNICSPFPGYVDGRRPRRLLGRPDGPSAAT